MAPVTLSVSGNVTQNPVQWPFHRAMGFTAWRWGTLLRRLWRRRWPLRLHDEMGVLSPFPAGHPDLTVEGWEGVDGDMRDLRTVQ